MGRVRTGRRWNTYANVRNSDALFNCQLNLSTLSTNFVSPRICNDRSAAALPLMHVWKFHAT